MSGCGRVPYTVGFSIGVVAVSGDHRSDFGLRFGLGTANVERRYDVRAPHSTVPVYVTVGLGTERRQYAMQVHAHRARSYGISSIE